MTAFITPPAPTTSAPADRSRAGLAAGIARWAVVAVLAAQFAAGGALKLSGEASMVAMFDDIGAGQGLRLVVGSCEVAGALGLLVPRLSRLAATALVLLMVGATATNIAVLHTSPLLPVIFGGLGGILVVSGSRTQEGR